MEPFNWVDIDGIRYSWDGQGSISCAGRFGYHATIAGDRLDGLEIENEAGEVAGGLYIDFATATAAYVPVAGTEHAHAMILVGHQQGQQEYPLSSLGGDSLHNLLEQSDPLAWSPIMEQTGQFPQDAHQHVAVTSQVLSWDSFHFEDESLLPAIEGVPSSTHVPPLSEPIVMISLELTNQVFDQLPPLHEI
ncbi:hypothetical protein [Aeromonas cavernicola]|uniref:Uncharacterized protein n=1 Tax=Aeromonas cavernicola TaxID=1006623 RepID=A0A2H9U624_9GAMM|nr:hypothetical protein [Aeromonas cavernicola]PJG59461.1 hypothetical protein CUC53_07335 [Aeromonas cavernicola]